MPVATGSNGSRLCENACTVLKSALLRKICQRLVNQQTGKLRRNAIFIPVLTVKPALKRFHTAWVVLCRSWLQSEMVKSDAKDWSDQMQTGGQVECNFAQLRTK